MAEGEEEDNVFILDYIRDCIIPRCIRTYVKTYVYYYWRTQEVDDIIKTRRYRQELFSLPGPYMTRDQRLMCTALLSPRPFVRLL